MDKYEYKLKLDELRELFQLKNYDKAAEIADEINWKKVRNAKTLCMVADVYEALERYDSCQDVLMQAYDHSSVGRNIVSRLTDIAIKSKDVQSAEEYYNEFIELAPRDTQGYVFAYKIACLKNAPLADRIAILEEFKEKEYSEMWAYELAVLYAQAGMREKCVETCDELILWFGDGEYVERALDLKRSFQPLTAAQEERYQKLLSQRGMVEINIPQKAEAEDMLPEAEENDLPAPDLIVTASKFNTKNLQEEISRSMEQIKEATEENTVRDQLNSIKKIVQDIPYLEGAEGESLSKREQIQEEVDEELKTDFQEKLVEETTYGQTTVKQETGNIYSENTAGMSIEDILADWERTKVVAEQAMAAAEQKKLDLEKEQALAEANDILRRLQELMPVLSATPGEDIPDTNEGTVADELLSAEPIVLTPAEEREPLTPREKEETSFLDALETTGRLPDTWLATHPEAESMDMETAAAGLSAAVKVVGSAGTSAEAAGAAAARTPASGSAAREDEVVETDIDKEIENIDLGFETGEIAAGGADFEEDIDLGFGSVDIPAAEDDFFDEEESEEIESLREADLGAAADDVRAAGGAAQEPAAAAAAEATAAAPAAAAAAAAAATATAAAAEATAAAPAAAAAATAAAPAATAAAAAATAAAAAQAAGRVDAAATEELNMDQVSDSVTQQIDGIEPDGDEASAAAAVQGGPEMADDIKEIFVYFLPIPGMTEQISTALSGVVKYKNGAATSAIANVIIQGEEGSGKTMLATELIKAAQKTMGREDDKIAKISAEALNKRDFASLIPKINGGYLIIENAGNLNANTVKTMAQVMDQNTGGMTVVLEDDSVGIRRALSMSYDFAGKFTEKIKIPIFTIDELVDFGKAYALEKECEIEEMAVLALYNRINNIQKVDHPTTLTEVQEIVDAAISSAESGGIKKIFAKKYNDEDFLILHEEDFAS